MTPDQVVQNLAAFAKGVHALREWAESDKARGQDLDRALRDPMMLLLKAMSLRGMEIEQVVVNELADMMHGYWIKGQA